MGSFLRTILGRQKAMPWASSGLLGVFPAAAMGIVAGQIDTFEGTNTAGWGGAPPVLVTSGGPAGDGDGFMRIDGSGGGPGGKITTYNRFQWIGDYISAGVTSVEMDLRNLGPAPLSIRIAFKQTTSNLSGGYSIATPFSLPNDGAWHHAAFSLSSDALVPVGFIQRTSDQLLMNPAEMRILHSVNPDLHGDNIVGSLGVDNIRAVAAPMVRQWKIDGSGSWGEPSSWTGGVPDAIGAEANLLGALKTPDNAPASISLDGDRTVGSIRFDNSTELEGIPLSYVIDGSAGGTLRINNGPAAGLITVASGRHAILAPVAIAGDAEISIASPSSSLDVGLSMSVASGKTLTKTAPGTASIARLTGGRLNIQNGTLRISRSGGVSVLESLSAGATGQFDLGDAGLVLTSGSLASVRSMLIAGRNAPGGGVANGKWNGLGGITSTAAATAAADGNEDLSVGYALNSGFPLGARTEFLGQSVAPSDIVLRMTRNADATLDGVVNNNDITVLAGFYRPDYDGSEGPRHWFQGDFNFDGIVNNNDITILAGFYQPSAPPIAPFGAALLPVPEPASAALLLVTAALGRRRRKAAQA